MKQQLVHISAELHKRLKVFAVAHGKTMVQVLTEALEDYFLKHGDDVDSFT